MKICFPHAVLIASIAGVAAVSVGRSEVVSALGRVLPVSGVVDIYGASGETVEEIRVKEGQSIRAGDSLARLSSYASAKLRVETAERNIGVLRRQEERDVALARQRIEAADTEATIAKGRFDRINASKQSEFVSSETVEQRTMARNDADIKLADAKAALEKTREAADKAIASEETELALAKAALASSEVRAPFNARVLKVLAPVGSTTGHGELLKIGDTSSMRVVAEVYESDILKLKPGMRAYVTSTALPKRFSGVVESVGTIVYRNTLQSLDPTALANARVVEISIKMDDVSPLDHLVFLQVDVTIEI